MAPTPMDTQDFLASTLAALDTGDLAQARQHCARALEAAPEDPGLLQLMGRLTMEAGDGAQALSWLENARQRAPRNPELLHDQAQVHLQLNHPESAVSCLHQALALAPKWLQARLQLASIEHRAGRIDQALEHYRQALEQEPNLAELHCQIGVCEFQRGNLQAARGWFESCLDLEPGHLDALENLGRTELEARRFESAKQTLEAVLAKEPRRAESHHLLGFVHLHLGDIDTAAECFLAPARELFALTGPGGTEPADPQQVTATKLRHDLEQLDYLADRDLLAPRLRELPQRYAQALAALPPSSPRRFFFKRPEIEGFAEYYNRLLDDFRPRPVSGGALNPALDLEAIEAGFHRRGWVYFDDFLNPRALAALQEFCRRSSIWFEKKFQYEVGASLRNGFCCPLLLQIGEELRERFPGIFGPHLFSGCFSYKYYQNDSEGHVHADRGAVSLNFWPTPDTANLDPDRGGLVIWNQRVPREYFYASPEEIDHLHASLTSVPGARAETIPYRCNRAMLFYSDVLHRSDRMRFRDGYEHRRVSITYLYGQPGDAGSPAHGGC